MPIKIALLFHHQASAGFGLLAASIFRLANRVDSEETFQPILVGSRPTFPFEDGELRLAELDAARDCRYVLIVPLDGMTEDWQAADADVSFLRSVRGMAIASSCLGAFLPAAAGLLDGREATTHWAWQDFARQRFPEVHWNTREMLIDHGDIITSGGLLSLVDLCLHIMRQTKGAEFARRVGRHLLADSLRQKQSFYATKLLAGPRGDGAFSALQAEIQRREGDPPSVAEMASICGMSLRTFHRRFQESYGVTPVKYLQLRRVETAKDLLSSSTLSLEKVAERSGFADMAFFRKIFTRETGLTPGQFRQRLSAV
ncbi:MAG: GlxA family transcriptional regulator [Allorhizobium sp.]